MSLMKKTYYIWDGEPLLAQVNSFESNGKTIHLNIGHVNIEKGDVVLLNYGASLGVSTRSGKGYENEFPFGKLTLFGTGICVELDGNTSKYLKKEMSYSSELKIKVEKQQQRVQPLIEDLYLSYQQNKEQKLKEDTLRKSIIEDANKKKVSDALEKMNAVFGQPKKKP